MDIYVLNKSFEEIAVIDSYKSLIWTKRYYTCGDFELYISADKELLTYLQPDYFLTRDDDSSVMIIEKLEITTSAEEGNFFIVSGRSLESVLARRIIYKQTIIDTTNPIEGIKTLIEENTTKPIREIPGLVVDTSFSVTADLSVQFTGDNLLDAITEICKRFNFGIKMTISNSNLIVSFYKGNETNVIFSSEFDNLISSDYSWDYTNYANYAVVAGEGEGKNRKFADAYNGATYPIGLSRREIFVDARDMSTNEGEISNSEYRQMLSERGLEKLNEQIVISSFEDEIEPNATFQYKTDYDLGDIVTVENEYGVSIQPRIIEIIESWDETGYTAIPTFEELEV